MRARAAWLLLALCLVGCDRCGAGARKGDTARCGKCSDSAQCRPGLGCLSGVCETAPPSCHVDIGL